MEQIFDNYTTYPCHNGHITIDQDNYLCGGKYKYVGIITAAQRSPYHPRFTRDVSTVLKYKTIEQVKCEECKKKQLELQKKDYVKSELHSLIISYTLSISSLYTYLKRSSIVEMSEYHDRKLEIKDNYCQIFRFYKDYQNCFELSEILSWIESEYEIILERFLKRKSI